MATVLTSVLFTDLVGSTALAVRLGPEDAETLRQTYFGLLRGAVTAAGGTEVKNLGDGLMVVCSSPSRALACAVGMQQALDHHNRRGHEPLRLRVGLSVGEANQENSDFFGEPVIEAARLCSAAAPGQILTTELVRAMVGRHSMYSLVSVGDLELKGLSEPVSAYEVAWEPAVSAGGGVPLPARLVSAATESLFGFFGRTQELAELVAAQKRAATSGELEVVLVTGEAGIGKTSLVAQAARQMHDQGVTVLLGRCNEDLATPYRPFREALGQLIDARGAEVTDALASGQRGALARVVPSLRDASSLPFDADAESELAVLLDAVSGLLRRASDVAPVVLVLDDLHWADQATLQLIRHLISGASSLPLLLAATYRDTDVSVTDPLSALLADLHRETGVARYTLRGLEDHELVDLIAAAAGHDLDDRAVAFAHAISRETNGNPFFTGELLRHLGETGAIFAGDDGRWTIASQLDELSLPGSIREVVGRRIRRLGPMVGRVLSLAAVVGRDFDLDLVTELAELDEDATLDTLETATVAALVHEHGDRPGRYRFTHALIQHILYQDLSAARRQRTHHRIAELLESRGDDPVLAGDLARHWLAATRPAELDKALHYTERAAEVALESLAPNDAIGWYSQALDLLARFASGDEGRRARLLLGLGSAQRLAGVAHRETLLAAARDAQRVHDTRVLVDAVLANTLGTTSVFVSDEDRITMARAALDAVGPGDSIDRARLLAALTELSDPADWRARRDLAEEAVAVARRDGHPQTIVLVETQTLNARSQPATHAARLRRAQEVVTLADRLAEPVARFGSRFNLLCALLQAGDRVAYEACITEMQHIAADTTLPYQRWQLLIVQTAQDIIAGNLGIAEASANETLELGIHSELAEALIVYGGQLGEIRKEQGRVDEIIELFSDAASEYPDNIPLQVGIAQLSCTVGRLDAARAIYRPIADVGFVAVPKDETWLLSCDLLTDVAVALHDEGGCRRLYDLLTPFAHLVISAGSLVWGSVRRPLGRLAHAIHQYEDAEAHFHGALAVHQRLGAPYFTARTQLEYAELLLDRDGPGDAANAATLVESVTATAAERGYAGLTQRIALLPA